MKHAYMWLIVLSDSVMITHSDFYPASSRWTMVKGKGSIPPPRTYHSNTSYWYKENENTGQFLVFSGGAVGTTPVRDRKVYKFDLGKILCVHQEYIIGEYNYAAVQTCWG